MLDDLNGDGVGDLVVHSLAGRRISSKQSTYEVHFGARAPDGGTAFASDVGATFQSKGRILLGMERRDFDRDGHVGLVLTSIEVKFLESSLWKRFKGLMGDDIQLDLEFYQTEDGLYPDKPNATRRIRFGRCAQPSRAGVGAPGHRASRADAREPEDAKKLDARVQPDFAHRGCDGDRRLDLLIESEFRELRIFVGVPGPDLFARRPQKVAVALHDEEYTWLTDLNKDGKQDILMHHPFTLRNAHGGPEPAAGNRAASADDADRSVTKSRWRWWVSLATLSEESRKKR